MKETKLKPCPFCGGKAEITNHTECAGHGMYIPQCYVRCVKCNAHGGTADGYFDNGDLKALAIERWNRRADNEQKKNKAQAPRM